MSKSEELWVHCNICKTPGSHLPASSSLNITSCGKLVCDPCRPRLQNVHCAACKEPCRTKVLDSKAPANILNMFKGVSKQLSSLHKILSWQESQKQSIKENRELEVRRMEEKAKQEEVELAKLEKQLEEKRVEVKSLETKKVQLKSQISSRLGLSGPVRSSKKVSFEVDGKSGKPLKPKVEVSSPVRKSSGKGSSNSQGPLSSARNYSRHFPPASSS